MKKSSRAAWRLGGAIVLVILAATIGALLVASLPRNVALSAGALGGARGTTSVPGPLSATDSAGSGAVATPATGSAGTPGRSGTAPPSTGSRVTTPRTVQAATATASHGALPLGSTDYPTTGAYVVSPTGDDRAGDGSLGRPWQTLGHAVTAAPNGATIALRSGTYHETLQVSGKKLTIQNWPGEVVWLSGSTVVSGFAPEGNAWRLDGWNPTFSRNHPQLTIDPNYPMAGEPDQVFVDGNPLAQASNRAGVAPGKFWVDLLNQRLYVGTAPAGHIVEASTLPWAIFFKDGGGSVLRGIGVRRYANSVDQLGAVHSTAAGAVFENDFFVQNAAAGLSVLGPDNHIVHDTLTANGQLGIGGHLANGLVASANLVSGNNANHFDPTQAAGGIKLTSSDHAVIADNLVDGNLGSGIWIDESSLDVAVVRNVIRSNIGHGILYEISAFGVIASNAVTNNQRHGIYVLESNDVEVWNNTSVDNDVALAVAEGSRASSQVSTPGHAPNRPIPDPVIPWDVHRITVRNNVFAATLPSATSIVLVDDATHQRPATAMQLSLDYDAYVRPTPQSPDVLAGWSAWPARMNRALDLGQFQGISGQEGHGTSASKPTPHPGQPLDARAAAALGLPVGAPVGVGIV